MDQIALGVVTDLLNDRDQPNPGVLQLPPVVLELVMSVEQPRKPLASISVIPLPARSACSNNARRPGRLSMLPAPTHSQLHQLADNLFRLVLLE